MVTQPRQATRRQRQPDGERPERALLARRPDPPPADLHDRHPADGVLRVQQPARAEQRQRQVPGVVPQRGFGLQQLECPDHERGTLLRPAREDVGRPGQVRGEHGLFRVRLVRVANRTGRRGTHSRAVVEEVARAAQLDQHPEQQSSADTLGRCRGGRQQLARPEERSGVLLELPEHEQGAGPLPLPRRTVEDFTGQPARAYAVAGQAGALGRRREQRCGLGRLAHQPGRPLVRHRCRRVPPPRSLRLRGRRQLEGQLAVVAEGCLGAVPGPRRPRRQHGREGRMGLPTLGIPSPVPGGGSQQRMPECEHRSGEFQHPGRPVQALCGVQAAVGEGGGHRSQRLVVARRGQQDRRPAVGREDGQLALVDLPEPGGDRQRARQFGRAGPLHRGQEATALEQGQRVAGRVGRQTFRHHRSDVTAEQDGGIPARESGEAQVVGVVDHRSCLGPPASGQQERRPVVAQPAGREEQRLGGLLVQPGQVVDHHQQRRRLGRRREQRQGGRRHAEAVTAARGPSSPRLPAARPAAGRSATTGGVARPRRL